MARVISVCNNKGGVGKTTIVANLGFALARNFKILLIDLAPQGNLSSGLGFIAKRGSKAKLSPVFIMGTKSDPTVLQIFQA